MFSPTSFRPTRVDGGTGGVIGKNKSEDGGETRFELLYIV